MRDPDLVSRARQAAVTLERAWERWRVTHGLATEPAPPVSSYVGYSTEEPWGRPRVVFGVDAREAEMLAILLDTYQGVSPFYHRDTPPESSYLPPPQRLEAGQTLPPPQGLEARQAAAASAPAAGPVDRELTAARAGGEPAPLGDDTRGQARDGGSGASEEAGQTGGAENAGAAGATPARDGADDSAGLTPEQVRERIPGQATADQGPDARTAVPVSGRPEPASDDSHAEEKPVRRTRRPSRDPAAGKEPARRAAAGRDATAGRRPRDGG